VSFRAIVATNDNGQFQAAIRQMEREELPAGEVLIRVAYSSLNYKDGLAVTGKPGVIRKFPMVPGVDFAGTVEESASGEFKSGDEVVVTGCGTSEFMWGGYTQYARIDAKYVVPLPAGMTLKQSMAVGTAGFTAMQAVMALEDHGLQPGDREVVVTGAAGGVGSVAVAILGQLGYKVVGSSGRPQFHDYLRSLGASEIIGREVLGTPSKKPLEGERWGGAIDNVGGETMAGLLRTMATGASIASCGVAGGPAVPTTVFPFILRGVNVLGIDSVRVPNARRREIWARVVRDLPLNLLDSLLVMAPLDKVIALGEKILLGQVRGRVVVDVNA
jgi:acrylyl-CoA reductase (NADPH)